MTKQSQMQFRQALGRVSEATGIPVSELEAMTWEEFEALYQRDRQALEQVEAELAATDEQQSFRLSQEGMEALSAAQAQMPAS